MSVECQRQPAETLRCESRSDDQDTLWPVRLGRVRLSPACARPTYERLPRLLGQLFSLPIFSPRGLALLDPVHRPDA